MFRDGEGSDRYAHGGSNDPSFPRVEHEPARYQLRYLGFLPYRLLLEHLMCGHTCKLGTKMYAEPGLKTRRTHALHWLQLDLRSVIS